MNIKRAIITALPYLIVLAGVVLAIVLVDETRHDARESNFYTRLQVCILTISPAIRTQESVDSCYRQVEQQTGIKADRYKVDGYGN